MKQQLDLEVMLGMSSDDKPAEVENLFSGRHDVNLNIKETSFTDPQTGEAHVGYTFDCYRVKSMSTEEGEIVNCLVRKKYKTDSEEFSLIRQKDTKPDEYAAYNTYCEECKALGKTIWGKLHNES